MRNKKYLFLTVAIFFSISLISSDSKRHKRRAVISDYDTQAGQDLVILDVWKFLISKGVSIDAPINNGPSMRERFEKYKDEFPKTHEFITATKITQ